jgi:hypothetical protein
MLSAASRASGPNLKEIDMRLPKSWAARIGVVVAAGAIAVTGATAAANASTPAAPHVTRIPTTLTISNTTPVLHKNGVTTAIINGHLTAGTFNLRGLKVDLERLGPKGRWHLVQWARTRVHGHVFFRVHIGAKAANFRLVFPHTRNFAKSISLVDTISPATS